MGAAAVLMRRRGVNVMQSGVGALILINLVLSFRPGISLGAHIGGLIGGAVAGSVFAATDDQVVGTAACVVLGAAIVAACVGVAAHPL